jgi:hypothetical protein
MSDPEGSSALQQARTVMDPFVSALAGKPGVQAVYVLSSGAQTASNPTRFDHESDFDVAVVVDVPMAVSEWRPRPADTYKLLESRMPGWLPNFLFSVPVPWGEIEVNVHQLVFQYEGDPRTTWSGETCDTYLTKREVIIDRDGLFERLIEAKVDGARAQLAVDHAHLANRITWDIREMPLRQARRLGPASGHYLLNLAIEEVVDCVYTAHEQFVPHKKWKLAHLSDRALITETQATILHEALRCDVTSLADLQRRVEALEAFCEHIPGLAISGELARASRRRFQSHIQLRERTFADTVDSRVMSSVGGIVRDVVNYHLCASSVDVAGLLASDSSLGPWQTVVPQIRAQLRQRIDEGLSHVS